ncbi:hypothetical protein HRbin36_00773 [bacterium HR36]|nr:hypothetical protein HRbin36_00773 [bacterium HR36]
MSKLATKQSETSLAEEAYGPSRIEERPPELARSVGFFGLCLLAISIVMLAWNAIRQAIGGDQSRLPFFNNTWITFCSLTGVALMYYHAAVDRAVEIRRTYSVLAWLAVGTGGLGLGFWAIYHWWGTTLAILISVIAGFIAVSVATCPWVLSAARNFSEPASAENLAEEASPLLSTASAPIPITWLRGLAQFLRQWNSLIGTDVAVTRITFGSVAWVALTIIVAALLTARIGWKPMPGASLIALLVGLAFVLTVAKHEWHEAWRNTGAYLLASVGYGAFALSLAYVVRDLMVTTDAGIFTPAGFIAGILSLVFFLAHINLAGSDADSSYYSAMLCLVAGSVLLALLGLARSLLAPLAFHISDTWRPSPYFLTNGLLVLILAILQLTTGLVTVSNNQLVAIFRRELLAYFYTPTAYLVLAGLAIIAGIQYLTWIAILRTAAGDLTRQEVVFQEPVVQFYFYGLFPVFALLAIPPFLTMRLFSEEKRTGTLEVLLVAPVSDVTVVLGKFLGAWAFFLVAWGLWFVFPLIFRFLLGQPFEYLPLLSFYVGTAFLVTSFIGLGVFFSAITDNQVIAAVLSYAGVLALFVPQLMHWQFTWAGRGTGEWLAQAVQQIAVLEQYRSFLDGQLYLQHLLYHLSIAAFFLFLTVRVLESRKWK